MRNRFFKTIIIFCICIGITIPVNAAVSVSDNSAFITKAEALAVAQSLSERIIVLENTVDEKIDNLITAYLERNGVWNAQEQVRMNYTKTVGLSNISTDGWGNAIGTATMFVDKFIANTSKSGVFSATAKYDGVEYSGELNLCRLGYQASTPNRMWSNSSYYVTLSIYEDNTEDRASHTASNFKNFAELRYTIIIGSAMGQRRTTNDTSYLICCFNLPSTGNYMLRPITFFTQKDSSLWWEMASHYKFTQLVGSVSAITTNQSGGKIRIEMTDPIIN